MNVEILEGSDSACDEYVRHHPSARICHLFEWGKVTADAMKLKHIYLVARENSVCGVLPLMHVQSGLFGNRMISQGFSDYGGILADTQQARDALFEFAVELAKRHNCESIEFRNIELLPYKELYLNKDKIGMRLRLTADPDELWKSFKKTTNVRNRVRRGQEAGLVTTSGGLELLDDFYRIYTIRMHQLGTPCYSGKIMKTILEMFPENSRIFVTRLKDMVVGAFFIVNFKEWAEGYWGAALVEHNNISPSHSLYWAVMKHFCVAGAKWFDFGRSTVEGRHYLFKKQWGPESYQLYYQYWVRPGCRLSIARPNNPKYKTKIEIWKRLPLWTTRTLGPYISRNLP